MASSPELHYWDETGGGNNAGRWRVLKALVLSEVAVNTLTSSNNGTVYSIKTPGGTNWTNIGSPYTGTTSVGTSFVKSGGNGSGAGIAIPPGTYSGGNPLLKAEVYEVLGAPRECNILIANKPLKPFTTIFWDDDVTEAQKASPPINAQLQMFHNLFPDFMYIRLVDSLTRHILFSGRVYEQLENFNGEEYGPQIELKARDNMAELARANMGAFANGILTPTLRRTDVIQHIIPKALWKGGSTAAGARTMVYDNPDKFHPSDNTFTEAEASKDYKIKGEKKTALKHISEIAAQDWYTDQAGTIVRGYDFHCDPEITSMRYDNEPPPSQLAYFKRMTEPTDDPLPTPGGSPASPKKGMIVQYKTKADVALADRGRRFPMLPDYNFSEQPNETYTDFIVSYLEYKPHVEGEADDDEYPNPFSAVSNKDAAGRTGRLPGGITTPYDMIETVPPIERSHNFTILYCDIPTAIEGYTNGIASGKFRVLNDFEHPTLVDANNTPLGIVFTMFNETYYEPRGDKCSTVQASALYTSATTHNSSTFVGIVQYQSGVGDNQYLIISHTEFSTVLDSLGPTDELYEATTRIESRPTTGGGDNTVVSFRDGNGTRVTLSGQAYPPNTLKMKRTKTLDLKQEGLNTALFRDVLAMEIAIGTGGETAQRGYFSIADFPHVKFTGNAQSNSTGTTLHLLESVAHCGIEKGTTLNHTDSNGNFYAGYANGINATSNIVTGNLYRPSTLANESGNNNAPSAFSGWAVNDAYTLLVPIRCGHVIFVDHVLAGVYGKHLITELSYTYQHGQVKTEFYTLGRNEARGALMPEYKDIFYPESGSGAFGLPFNSVDATLFNIRWIYTDYNTLGWAIPSGGSGYILLKNNISSGSFEIDATNTDVLNGNTPMVADKVYMLYFDHKTNRYSFQLGIIEGAGKNYIRKGHYIEIGRITIGDISQGQNRVNFNILIGGETTNRPFNMAGLDVLTPNSLAATLLKKMMQPYQHNLTIKPGKADGSYINTHVTVFSGGAYDEGVINFADATSANLNQNYTVGDGDAITAGAVRYLYFRINANHESGDNVFEINWTPNYTLAVSDTRGLLAMVTKATNGLAGTYNGIPEPSEDNSDKALSVITFRGHTDTISANFIAARAISSLHITTNQIIAKDFRTAINVGDNWSSDSALAGVGGILINADRIAGYADSVGSANPVIEFELRSATGKAYFDGGKAIIDCDGMRFYKDTTHNANNFMLSLGDFSDTGINMKGGTTGGGITIRGDAWDGLLTSGGQEDYRGTIYTTGNGATGSTTTTDSFLIQSSQTNLHLHSSTHSIILEGDDGIKIIHETYGTANNDNWGLLFMASGDTGEGSSSAIYTGDFVGIRGPAAIGNSSIYVLPEVFNSYQGRVLAIKTVATITGSGSITAPYVATLEWVTGGGADAFKFIDIDNDWTNSGYTWGTNVVTASGADKLYLVAGTGIELQSDSSQDTGNDGAPAIKISATGSGTGTVNTGALDYLAYYSTDPSGTTLSPYPYIKRVSGHIEFYDDIDVLSNSIYFRENPTNGTHYTRLKAASSLSSNTVFILPNSNSVEYDFLTGADPGSGLRWTALNVATRDQVPLRISKSVDEFVLTVDLDGIPYETGSSLADLLIVQSGTNDKFYRMPLEDIDLSRFNNDLVSSSGTVTSVNPGNGMVFNPITGSGSVNLGDPSDSSPSTSNATTSGSGSGNSGASHTHRITGTATSGHNHSSAYSTWAFKTIVINNPDGSGYSWGTNNAVAEAIDDALYLVEGTNITLQSDTTGGGAPAIKISASGGGATYTGGTGIDISGANAISLNLSELDEKQSSFAADDFFGMVTDGGTTYKIKPAYINVQLFNNNNYYALNSHSHSYDNYVSWRYRTDTATLEDVISNETVKFTGAYSSNISVTHSGGVISIDHDDSGVSAAQYTNATVTVDSQGHVTAASSGSSGGVTDHGALGGLTDDDHSQYGLLGNTRGTQTWTARHTFTYSPSTLNLPAIWLAAAPGQWDKGYWLKNETTPSAPSSGHVRVFLSSEVFSYRQSDGTIISLAASTSSSLALKDNVRTIEIDTSKVLILSPKTFEWKDAETVPEYRRGVKDFGLIAEEVHEILPELVIYNGNNEPVAINYHMISVLLLEEMKNLKARIEVLEGI